MLSTENPPSDLCEIPQLKSGDDGSGESNQQQQLLGVDLFKSGLDDKNPLPNFSIRDYVFNTRGKEIKNNWPFSQKNLQLCLKHGVKDVLPPFQPVRNPSHQSVVDSLRYSDVKFPESKGCGVCKRPALNADSVNSSECEEDKEFLSIRESKKAEINIQSPVKKCRLIVEQRANEDTAVVSETMTSKVCPVCKTFSSSSNTTLNAHIDQCLSGESTIEWTANPKVNKHRIKPRKTRLMVDIYETALRCTLEDLDKRNGTSWASNTGLHPQDPEVSVEEERTKKTCSPLDFEDINCEGGAVYIDSCGTKVRILSKLNHPSSKSTNVNDSRACKLVKRDKGIQFHLTKKKKKHTVQRLEVQKNSLDGQGSCSPVPDQLPDCSPLGPKTYYPMLESPPCCSQINEGQTKVYPSESHEEDDPTKSPTASDHMKFNDFGMIKGWVRSKRTGLKKKNNLELEIQHPDKSLKNLQVKNVSLLGDRGNSAPISPISSNENPVLPPEGLKRKENLCRSPEGGHELPCLRKGPGFSSLRSEHRTEKKNHLASKFNVKQSRKDISSVHERISEPPNRAENHAPSRSNKRGGSSSLTVKNVSSFGGSSISHHRTFSNEGVIASPKKRSLGHAMSPGGRKFTSLRTMLLSVKHPSGEEPKKNLGRDLSSFKNPWLRCTSRSDDEAVVSQPTFRVEDNLVVKKNCGEPLKNRTGVLKRHKRIGRFVNTSEGDMTSKGSETSRESDSDDVGNKIDSFMAGSVPIDSVLGEEVEMMDDFVCEPAETDGEAFVSFNKSLDSAFPVGSVSQYYSKAYDGHCPTELVFHSDREMFRADNAGKNLVTPDCHEMSELDGDEAQGNYFVDVDPIPIPGPPGSFLPSPGRMGSEELLGHSSLTTCRIQSSDGGHEVVDMDSSDSPISAMSTVSNSIAGRSSSISTTNLSAQSHFTAERNNPVVEGFPPFEQIACVEKEPNHVKMSYEVQNIQPCCCSRKDASLQGGSLNYQESQLLRRRAVTPLSVIPQEKQITKNEICFIDLTAETLSEKEPMKSASGYVPHNPEAVLRDSEFPSPSTPNPVLRLMGKNLMVVNKDDNLPSQSSTMIEHPGVRLCVENGRHNQNEPNSLHRMLSQGPSYMPAHRLDFNPSDPFKIPTNYRPPCHPPTTMNPSVKPTSAPGYHEYGNGFSLISPDTRPTAYDSSEWALRRKILLVADARK